MKSWTEAALPAMRVFSGVLLVWAAVFLFLNAVPAFFLDVWLNCIFFVLGLGALFFGYKRLGSHFVARFALLIVSLWFFGILYCSG